MFFCEICKVFQNTYFEEHLPTTASLNHCWYWILILSIVSSWHDIAKIDRCLLERVLRSYLSEKMTRKSAFKLWRISRNSLFLLRSSLALAENELLGRYDMGKFMFIRKIWPIYFKETWKQSPPLKQEILYEPPNGDILHCKPNVRSQVYELFV